MTNALLILTGVQPEGKPIPGPEPVPEEKPVPERKPAPETPSATEDPPAISDEVPETEAAPEAETAPAAPGEEIGAEEEAAQELTEGTIQEEASTEPVSRDLRTEYFTLWIALAVLAGAIIGAGAALLIRRLIRKPKKAEKVPAAYPRTEEMPGAAPSGSLQISKLHEQGARSSQQDSFAVTPAELIPTKGTLAVVCDGMGGLQDGDKVSQTAVSAMINGFLDHQGDPERLLLALLARANQAVNRLLGPAGQKRSGSTMVAGILKDSRFSWLSVGDSRICLYRGGQLIQLNREHIYGNELSTDAVNDLTSFREAWSDPQQSALTSFLGMGELKYIDIPAQSLDVLPGDKLILMSDGVYNALTEDELKAALDLPSGQDTEALGAAIAEKNYERQDNYTAVVLTNG